VANLLKALGKKFVVFNSDRVPKRYSFFPHTDLVQNELSPQDSEDPKKRFDAAIVLDCPNLRRTGRVKDFIDKVGFVINIDHHVSNDRFGDLNWVEKDASSAGEMVYTLYKRLNCKITKETALFLYVSILTDTGSFNYSNTSSATHEIVSELLDHGIKPYDVSKTIYENKKPGEIILLGKVLSDIKFAAGGKIAYVSVTRKLFSQTDTGPAACENLVNFARSVKGVDGAVSFRENMEKRDVVNVSFRSKQSADVNKIAAYFGGGGHKNAAGCTLRGSLKLVRKKVLDRIKDEL